MEKRRVTLHIAGRTLTIVTDEAEENVRAIEQELDQRISALSRSISKMTGKDSRVDAVILCALDLMSEARGAREDANLQKAGRIEAEKKNRELYDEYSRLAARLKDGEASQPVQDLTKKEKISKIEELLRARKSAQGGTDERL